MRISFAFAALASAALSTAAIAQTTPSTPGTEENGGGASAKPEKPKKAKKICRETDQSYSRMPTRTCKTAEQWAAEGEGHRNGTNDLKGRAN
jgi:hypothetical protein